MASLPQQEANPHGLYHKYNITRADGKLNDEGAVFIVLRIDRNGGDKLWAHECRKLVHMLKDRMLLLGQFKKAQDLLKLLGER